MTYRTKQKGKVDVTDTCLPVNKGGIGSDNIIDGASNLKLITNAMKNIPNGVIGVSSNGLLSPTVLPPGLSLDSSINITGPLSLSINQVQAYTITDYDIGTTYTLAAIGGSISRTTSTITYTAPGVTGAGGFTINGKSFNIAIGATLPNTPSISSPSTGSTGLLSSVIFTGTAFSMLSGSDTHEGSDWQVATDAGFTSIVSQVVDDITNKTSWTVVSLLPNTTYYARVRYKGAIYGYSSWSSTVNFTTKSVFTPTIGESTIVGTPRDTADYFGRDVAMNDVGTLLVIGADGAALSTNPSDKSGGVFIYSKSGGSYIQDVKLEKSIAGGNFGYSVAVSSDGTRIAIGQIAANTSGVSSAGVVYIYSKVSGSWIKEATLSDPAKISGNSFGNSLDLDATGTRVVIGGYLTNTSGLIDTGAAFVFTRTDTNWVLEQTLNTFPLIANAYFGYSVAIDSGGNRIVVSAPYENKTTSPAAASRGYIYIYSRSGVSWTQEAKVSDGATNSDNEHYGESVDIDSTGTRIVLSIPFYNGLTAGAALVLKRTGTSWALESFLNTGETTIRLGEGEGKAVSISSDGSVVAVGDSNMTVSGNVQNGSVFIFTRSGTTWTKINRLNASLYPSGYFGKSVELTSDGSKVLVGAYTYVVSSVPSGAAFTFV